MSLLRQRAELRGLPDQGHAVEVVPPEGLLRDPAGEASGDGVGGGLGGREMGCRAGGGSSEVGGRLISC